MAGDLERNLKEQDRIGGEIEALQAQLAALQQDQAVLVNIQQALGVTAAPARPYPESVAAVPSPRRGKTAATSAGEKQARAGKSAAPARKRTGKKFTAAPPATPSVQPTLVDLVREDLAGQHEPRSAAEIATALDQQHSGRENQSQDRAPHPRRTRGQHQAQRTKQGRSVFYTLSETTEPDPQDELAAEHSS